MKHQQKIDWKSDLPYLGMFIKSVWFPISYLITQVLPIMFTIEHGVVDKFKGDYPISFQLVCLGCVFFDPQDFHTNQI